MRHRATIVSEICHGAIDDADSRPLALAAQRGGDREMQRRWMVRFEERIVAHGRAVRWSWIRRPPAAWSSVRLAAVGSVAEPFCSTLWLT